MKLAMYYSKCSYRMLALFLPDSFSIGQQSINLLSGFVHK